MIFLKSTIKDLYWAFEVFDKEYHKSGNRLIQGIMGRVLGDLFGLTATLGCAWSIVNGQIFPNKVFAGGLEFDISLCVIAFLLGLIFKLYGYAYFKEGKSELSNMGVVYWRNKEVS